MVNSKWLQIGRLSLLFRNHNAKNLKKQEILVLEIHFVYINFLIVKSRKQINKMLSPENRQFNKTI